MKAKIAVVIPVLSAFKEAILCLSLIRTEHIWTPYIAPQWEDNKSIASVWNTYSSEAFESGYDFALILNDDGMVFPSTVDALVEEMRKDEALLVSGWNTHGWNIPAVEPQRVNLDFSCFMISAETFKAVGYFDENFYPAYFEDNDFHRRMILLDLPAYGISEAPFNHLGSVTFRTNEKQLNLHAHFNAARAYYVRKWGGVPGQERFVRPFSNPHKSVKEWELE